MADDVRLDIDGGAFYAALDAATKEMRANASREIRKLGNDVANRAKQHAPVNTGRLRSSIDVLSSSETADTTTVKVGTRVNYAAFVEYGTGPHDINVKTKKVLADNKGHIFGRHVHHPGTRPQPFMRPALLEAVAAWHPRITD